MEKRTTLEEMKWNQPATSLISYNYMAEGIINETILQNRSRDMDMRFYWLEDREQQYQFRVIWKPGT